jgi:ubiquinone biosynthesis protein COQ4
MAASASDPSLLLRAKRVTKAASILFRDHTRVEQVLEINANMNLGMAHLAAERIGKTEAGRRLLVQRPLLNRDTVDFAALKRLPDGTLGREWVRFLEDNGITPDIWVRPDVGDELTAYVLLRFRQTHDLWHVVSGYGPDVLGELLLQAFTFGQTLSPGSFGLSILGSMRWARSRPGIVGELREAYYRGRSTRQLITLWWEDWFEEPVTELRDLLGCP